MSTTTLTAPETEVISFDQFNPTDAADSSTLKFISFYLANPGDAMSKAFTTIITSKSTTLAADVAAFFAAYSQYSSCTLDTYLMGMVYQAQQQDSVSKPADEKKYSLGTLVKLLGGKWPDGLPDPAIAKPSCSVAGGLLNISFELDFTTLNFENAIIAGNVRKLVTDATVQASLQCNYQPGAFIFETKIIIVLDNINLPLGNAQTLSVTKPTVTLDVTPEFKYVVFTMSGDIPATIFDTPVDVDISLIIDNDEASIGASIAGNNASLPAPPGVKGLHFDQIGACMGLFFEPPGFAFGLQGKFHIGDSTAGNLVDLDDDTFALVCEYMEEAIAPKYVAFYVPRLDINKVIELFTNANPNINIPVNFNELGFRWSTGVNDSVALPDGTLSQAGWGFSADVDIFSFQFHGEANLDLNSGLTANVEMAPLSWKNVFGLSGDGKGYSVKVDANGNPIRNNQVINTQALQDAVAKATSKQLVAPGGPVLVINTLSQPILHLNAKASLFDLASYEIQADINKDGITFLLDYGVVLKQKMSVTLSDFHNLAASFMYYINQTITVPVVDGVRLGAFHLAADVETHFSIATSLSDIKMNVGGSFNFEGLNRKFGDFTADINISKITDLLIAIGKYIEQEAKQIFSDFLNDAQQWANKVKSGFLTGADEVGTVLKNVWHADSIAVASIMKNAGYAIDDISHNIKDAWNCTAGDVTYALKAVGYTADEVAVSLKNVFNAASQDVAAALKQMGYTANEVADAIKNAWNCGLNDVAWAMQWVGYSATEVGGAVQHAFGTLAQDAANDLKYLSYTANQIGSMIKDAFGGDSVAVAKIMKAAGYAASEVAGAIKNAWNCGVNDVTWAMQQVGYAANDICGALKDAFNASAQDVANAFKTFGIAAQDTADAIKNVYNLGINDAASVLKQAGYATSDVASALKNAFNTSVDAVGNAMKQVGYAADDVKNAFDSLGGDFKSFADTAWGDAKHYLNPSNW